MQNFPDTFKTCKRSFFSAFLICMTVPLIPSFIDVWISRGTFRTLSNN